MIRRALKDISKISNDDTINTENYLDAINYIDNLYHVIAVLKRHISVKQITFLPSFKGKYICEKLGLPSTPEENDMRLLKVASDIFLVDKDITDKIIADMEQMCEKITLIDKIFIFILK